MKTKSILMIAIVFTTMTIGCKKKTEEPTPATPAAKVVGESYGGGIIFYVDGSGQHGLVAATADQSTGVSWNNGTNVSVPVAGFLIGDGQANTTSIVNTQGSGTYAASICDQLVLNGYSDWFLPSKNELDMLYQQKDVVGGFSASSSYWSSSQSDAALAWKQQFNITGGKVCYDKFATFRVRAVRAF